MTKNHSSDRKIMAVKRQDQAQIPKYPETFGQITDLKIEF